MSSQSPPASVAAPVSLYEAALEYALHGWQVFPTRGKVPLTPNGFKDATVDAAQITKWWTEHRDAGIASPVRPGEIVLDIDPRNGGEQTFDELMREHGALPPTLKTRTGGGGIHLRLKLPKGIDASRLRGSLGPGLDVKLGERGYVMLPPSPHASGGRYEWEPYCGPEDQDIAEVPQRWFVSLLKGGATPASDQRQGLNPASVLSGVQEGARDRTLFEYASSLRARSTPRVEAEALVLAAARACRPPFPDSEALAKAEQAWKFPEGKSSEFATTEKESIGRPLIVTVDQFIAEERSPVPSLWGDGALAERSINVLAGESGIGKTMFLLNLLLHLSKGMDFLGLPAQAPRRCFLLEGEGNRDALRERVETAARSCGIDLSGLPLFFAARGVEFSIGDTVLRAVMECAADLTVLDTVGLFHEGDENSATDWKKYVVKPERSIIEQTGTAFLNLHHFSKPSENRSGGNRIRGTSAMKADSDTTLTLEDAKAGRGDRILTFEKVKNGPSVAPMVLHFDEPDALFTLTTKSAAAAGDPRLQAIVSMLMAAPGGQMTRASLVERLSVLLGCGETTVDDLLRTAKAAGMITRPKYGIYGLPGQDE